MIEPAFSDRVAKRTADPASAIFALKMASETLDVANEMYSRNDYNESFERSRDAIRLVSSALMFRDGYVSDTLEGSIAYLLERYPGMFPVEAWERIESFQSDHGTGILAFILRILGKVNKAGAQEAKDALRAASSFVDSARAEMVL